jgi:hypothetical protein
VIFLLIIVAYVLFLSSRSWSGGFNFNRYEGFLGLGTSDEAAATRDFVRQFPVGTSLEGYREYFAKIGGHCVDKLRAADELTCGYAHMRYPPLPILFNTWSAVIKYDPTTMLSSQIKITPGYEGL